MRKPGAKGQFVIKVIRPRERAEIFGAEAATILETEGVAAEHQAEFLEAVRFQKKAADARARNIAPVHDIGSTEDEAWYVTNYYPREALKKLVVCRYNADAADLHHLVASVVQGLLDLKRHCGRTHGRLKATTILMDGKRGCRLAKTRLLLTDLAPGSAADAERLELADLRAIGTIVHQLVRRREVRAQDTWIGEGEEWKPLGKLADGWRELCNKLGSPDLTLEKYSLEQLQKDVRKLKPRLPPLVVGGAALLALLLLGGGAYYYHNISTHASLAIGTEPTGARVLLGQKQIAITPYRELVAPGQWTYGLKLDGHYDTNVNVLARAGWSTNVFVRMIPWQGELMVTSKPPGARVVIQPPEGVRIEWLVKTNTTPFIINVPVSKVTGAIEPQLEAKFGNLPKKSKAVVVEKDQRQTVEFVFTRGSVRLDSLPSGAVVLVDGREVGRTPFVDDNVAPGTATYELRLAGYNTDIAQINVVEDKVTQMKRLLTKGGGTVVVRSDPEGAEVLRLGVVLGRTPFRTKLEAGRQRLVVRHAVLGEQTVDVDVKQDAEIGKEVRFARGSVRLASQPVGAEVLVDGKVVGMTPYENLVVPPGKMITYELRKGTLSEVLQLQVADGQALAKSVVLTSGQGVVVVSSDPVGADIFWRSRTGDQLLGKAGAGGLRSKPIEKG
ncbi:MAG: PEGA domain-containing protein, partial [Verrucomicrobia bacterium]|nr:PEGA domain-containing protein [Verrucomicrobiota bacterium]